MSLAVVQQEAPFPPDMSPTSPLLSPQSSTPQTPLLQQAPPPGYQSPDMKSWQQTGISSNRWERMKDRSRQSTKQPFSNFGCFPHGSLFSPSGQGAAQTFGQQGVYNNMSITVSMAGGSGGASSLPPMAQSVGNSNLNSVIPVCSDQQVSQSPINTI